ncbi:MAG: DUF1330 domain-containing protein [Pseudomonadota bacterium]
MPRVTPSTRNGFRRRSNPSAEDFSCRGGRCETLESGWQPKRVVALAFPSMEKAKVWWASEIYAEPKALRQRTARARMIAVQGGMRVRSPARLLLSRERC